jgi:multiple sugar transport system permease protein
MIKGGAGMELKPSEVRMSQRVMWKRMHSWFYWFEKLKLWSWIAVRSVLIIGISYVILYPILLKISIAFKSRQDLYDATVVWIPKHFTLENFWLVFRVMNYPTVLLNTVLLSAGVMLLQTLCCVMAGYGFARIKFRGSGLLFACVILTILVPPQTIMLPTYLQFRHFDVLGIFQLVKGEKLNLIDTYAPFLISGLFGMGLKTGLYVYIFRQFFRGIPREIEEAAFVDGAGTFSTFARIILPNAIPSLITVMLFSFVWQWNDSFYTTMYLNNPNVISRMMSSVAPYLAVHLGQVTGRDVGSYINDPFFVSTVTNAGILLAILPLLLFYFLVQRHFVESVERTGLVG